tara:strand:- start:521 stop:712 length:192 start_codon:yes stop_codon:yes gene_type:complete
MDITIKVKTPEGKEYSCTFIGNKDRILSSMQDYIKRNIDNQVNVVFNNEKEKSQFTYQELFNT